MTAVSTPVVDPARIPAGQPIPSRDLTRLPGVVLAHRSDLMLSGMTLTVSSVADIRAIHTLLSSLLADLARCRTALVIMEDRLSNRAGCTATGQIAKVRALAPDARLIVVGALYDGVYVGDLLNAGAHAYLCDADPLIAALPDAVRTVTNGRGYLSPSAAADYLAVREQRQHGRRSGLEPDERQALALLLEGCDVPETMRCLNATRDRVYRLHQRLRARFGVATNEALIQRVLVSGLPSDAVD